jgi:hypothetical protein
MACPRSAQSLAARLPGALFVPIAALFVLPGCRSDEPARPSADTVPPARIETLSTVGSPSLEVTLTWQAPGDDGVEGRAALYEIRSSPDSLTDAAWDAATVVANPPSPGVAGQWEVLHVTGLALGSWYFAIKASDEASNWSALSNSVTGVVADVVAPAAVTDLDVVGAAGNRVTLMWTAPGGNGTEGTAAEYDLRYSTSSIADGNWSAATRVDGLHAPSAVGAADSFTVAGLAGETTYYFALTTADESRNWSELSNNARVTTGGESRWRITFSRSGRTAVSPTWSLDGSEVAFNADWSGNQEIYLVPSSGGTVVRLTDDPADDADPAWSPDGTRIAFNSDRGDSVGLWVMDSADGSNALLLAQEHIHDMHWARRPCWSPDGSRIAYTVGAMQLMLSSTRVYAVASAGGTPQLLIDGGEDWGSYDPAWSPDGTRIAFASTRGYNWGLWIQSLAGGDPVLLVRHTPDQFHEPCWSPDGQRIAYTMCGSGDCQMFVIPSTGGGSLPLTWPSERVFTPAWSPDGQMIAFSSTSDRERGYDVWVMRVAP